MKLKRKLGIVTFITVFILCVFALNNRAYAASIVKSGFSGGLDWTIDSNGVLRISGNGGYEQVDVDYEDPDPDDSCNIGAEWCEYRDLIKSAVVNVKGMWSYHGMFLGCYKLEKVTFKKCYGDSDGSPTDMACMFKGCSKLKTIVGLNKVDSRDVFIMNKMFKNCKSLKTVDLSGLDKNDVTDAESIFLGCSSLKKVNFSGFSSKKLADLWYAFDGCSNLKSLGVKVFNINNSRSLAYAFRGCRHLTLHINLGNSADIINNQCFKNAATANNANIWITYSSKSKKSTVQELIATKSAKSHVMNFTYVKSPKTSLTDSGIQIKCGDNLSGYAIYRKAPGESKYKKIKTTSKTSFIDTKVKDGKKYSYKIKRYIKTSSGTVYSSFSAAKNITFYTNSIAKPVILSVTNSGKSTMTVTWKKNTKAFGYEVCIANNKAFKSAKTYICSTAKYVYTKAQVGKWYYVKVRAIKKNNTALYYSSYSAARHIKIKK